MNTLPPPPPLPITTAEQTRRLNRMCERFGIYFLEGLDWLRYLNGDTDEVPTP